MKHNAEENAKENSETCNIPPKIFPYFHHISWFFHRNPFPFLVIQKDSTNSRSGPRQKRKYHPLKIDPGSTRDVFLRLQERSQFQHIHTHKPSLKSINKHWSISGNNPHGEAERLSISTLITPLSHYCSQFSSVWSLFCVPRGKCLC